MNSFTNALLLAPLVGGCSNVLLDSEAFTVHARTMDLGSWDSFEWVSVPPEVDGDFGFLGIYPKRGKEDSIFGVTHGIAAGMNMEGLSCDFQTLLDSSFPNFSHDDGVLNVMNGFFCDHVLRTYNDVDILESDLRNGTLNVYGPDLLNVHFVLRDRAGSSLIVEFMNAETIVYRDSVGIFTNEPTFDYHLMNVAHWEWKKTLERPVMDAPGTFYPEARFLRLHSLKSGLDEPSDLKEAIMDAVHLLNSVTVPRGEQYGTDSGAGEGSGDHTVFGLVYDHDNASIYWRSYDNQQLKKIDLRGSLNLDVVGGEKKYSSIVNSDLTYFDEVTNTFTMRR